MGPGGPSFPDVGLAVLVQYLPFQAHSGLCLHGKGYACDDDCPPGLIAEVKAFAHLAPAAHNYV